MEARSPMSPIARGGGGGTGEPDSDETVGRVCLTVMNDKRTKKQIIKCFLFKLEKANAVVK